MLFKTIIFLIIMFVLLFITLLKTFKKEKYNYKEENPNALITGKNIAGTVYSSEPENVPGLGWVI